MPKRNELNRVLLGGGELWCSGAKGCGTPGLRVVVLKGSGLWYSGVEGCAAMGLRVVVLRG